MDQAIARLQSVKSDTCPGRQLVFSEGAIVFDLEPIGLPVSKRMNDHGVLCLLRGDASSPQEQTRIVPQVW